MDPDSTLESPPNRVGNIKITGVLGRGGMGDVFVGFDEVLRRKVAVKAIRGRHRDRPKAHARFLREARFLSKLDHPNICRIYDYVQKEDAQYLVLELIDGTDLDKAIKGRLEEHAKLEIAIQIATALTVAHGEGIVHRDLKPSNAMLTPDGTVKVLDFGLARLEEKARSKAVDFRAGGEGPFAQSTVDSEDPTLDLPGDEVTPPPAADRADSAAAEDAEVAGGPTTALWTRDGQVVGTALYMSPEQARGRPATTASDMYSFGLLLQTLFTGRPAYDTSIGVRAVLEKAGKAETLPVEGVRSDLRALIERLKAASPAARATAVDTLERLEWIRDTKKRRLRRLAVAAAVVVAVLAGVKYTVDVSRERATAVEARQIAEQRRAQAEDLIGFMLGDLRKKLQPVGRLEILDDVAEKGLEYFAAVPEEELSADELSRRSMALYQLGEVRIAQGKLAEAEAPLAESLTLAKELAEREPANNARLFALGQSCFWVGYVHWMQDNLEAALGPMQAYMEASEELVRRDPESLDWQLELSYSHSNLGSILQAQNDFAGAERRFARSLELKQQLVDRRPDNFDWLLQLAEAHNTMGLVLQRRDRLAAARQHFETEIELKQSLLEADPAHAQWRDRLAVARFHLASLLASTGHLKEARDSFRTAAELLQQLAADDPANVSWQWHVAFTRVELGETLRELGNLEEAWTHASIAGSSLFRFLQEHPDNVSLQRYNARGAILQGNILRDREELPSALMQSQRAVAALKVIVARDPADHKAQRSLGAALVLVGDLENQSGRVALAEESWSQTIKFLQPAVDDGRCVECVLPLIKALLYLGRTAEASRYLELFLLTRSPDTELRGLLGETSAIKRRVPPAEKAAEINERGRGPPVKPQVISSPVTENPDPRLYQAGKQQVEKTPH